MPLPPHNLLLLPLILLPLTFASPNANAMEGSETETLFSIMSSMSSDRDWRSYAPDPCSPGSSWPGIECKPGPNGRLHVTKLIFGTPPNPTCKASATFPSQIFDLPFLQSAHFFSCFKSKKTTLFFPRSSLSSPLQQLSLRANPSLIGAIPPQIAFLKSLQVLTLSQNHLHGEIPESISSLSSLIHLDLSYNSLNGRIPPQMGKMTGLIDLDLSYNSLTGLIPPSIGEMGSLQKLDLSSNSLWGSIPQSFGKLKMLTFLALSDNRLNGFPHIGLEKLQSLQYLIIDSNPMFTPLPPELGELPRLQELRLANSGYSGAIPRSFTRLRNLTTLSLGNNHLSGEIPQGLGGLSKMYHLNLSRNMLTGVVPFSDEFLRRLGRNLDLSGNPGLCLNGTGGLEGILGVGVCGKSSSSSSSDVEQPLDGSRKGASSLGDRMSYWGFGIVGFSAMYCLCLL
ncbi:Protein too many mouths [Apostasia shenzhenica]|uniref:Protein too many mouths n=1 Tax=Apostasia shenzhenica TaxID=1088818 RepID=A0A2I0BC22_9ASPA|nr:Protein too many mouths [Apostasia shenzhenica]